MKEGDQPEKKKKRKTRRARRRGRDVLFMPRRGVESRCEEGQMMKEGVEKGEREREREEERMTKGKWKKEKKMKVKTLKCECGQIEAGPYHSRTTSLATSQSQPTG